MGTSKPITVTTGRHPFQVFVLGACTLTCAMMLVSGVLPRSMVDHLPDAMIVAWQVLLALGGLAGLLGTYWRGQLDTGLIIEAGGVFMFGASILFYVSVIFTINGLSATTSGVFLGSLALAAWWRAAQITRDVRRLWAAAEAGHIADVPLLWSDGDGGQP